MFQSFRRLGRVELGEGVLVAQEVPVRTKPANANMRIEPVNANVKGEPVNASVRIEPETANAIVELVNISLREIVPEK